jgi:disulfide bond formation protein DsbB
MVDSLIKRIGLFFFIIGLGLIILFLSSNLNLLYLLLAAASLLLGISMLRKSPRPESSRFSSLKRIRRKPGVTAEEEQIKKEHTDE